MQIQLPFWSFQLKTLAREVCINTRYLLPVSTWCTTMPMPLSCSSSKLWLPSRTASLPACEEAPLPLLQCPHPQGCCSLPLLCTSPAICSTHTSLHIEGNRKSPAIDQTSKHIPCIRNEDVEQPKYFVIFCLCFTALLLHRNITERFGLERTL